MEHMIVKQSAVINAPIEIVYAVLRDYEVGHRAILPEPFFESMEVLKGGQGEGTEIFIEMEVFGQEFTYHQRVTEPIPGHQLVERDINTGLASTFFLEPVGENQTRVHIESEVALSKGFQRIMEKLFNPMIIGGIFKKELQNLADYVAKNQVITA